MQGNFTPSQRDQANFAPFVSIAYHTYALLRNAMHATRLHARSRGKKISFHEEGNTKKNGQKSSFSLYDIYNKFEEEEEEEEEDRDEEGY